MSSELGNTVFRRADCLRFAELSGDANPVHVDDIYARRSVAGRCVVHGMLILLQALEAAFANGVGRPLRIEAKFRRFVCVDDEVAFRIVNTSAARIQIMAIAGDRSCADVTLHFEQSAGTRRRFGTGAEPVELFRTAPLDEPVARYLSHARSIDLERYGSGAEAFPSCSRVLGDDVTRAFYASTYFIGMVCPGLNSIYSAIDVDLSDADTGPPVQRFRLDRFDERVARLEISASGPLTGTLTAFRRPEPVAPEHISVYRPAVVDGAFAGLRALVVGGSRGLGAAAAKMLALGGAEVAATYANGAADASAMAEEIESTCRTQVRTAKFDLLADAPDAINEHISRANVILYFATPRIRQGPLKGLDKQLHDTYVRFYVEKVLELCQAIEALEQPRKIVYVPSTTFIESRPLGFLEYALAKSACEVLCDEINQSFSHVRTLTTRLPQLRTDQTASMYTVKYESIVDTLYPLLRRLNEAANVPA